MRKRFEQQTELGYLPINEIQFPLKSRDELPAVLMALHFIFITPELNKKVFDLLEEIVCSGKKKTGRSGMDLWHILVLAVVRHARNADWDQLQYLSEYDILVRQLMGIEPDGVFAVERIKFPYQTIVDNVSLIDEATLEKINQVVVECGHKLLKKKDEKLCLKTDSFVFETNVHYPTDLNLLWDSLRKGLDKVEDLCAISDLQGWRKIKLLRRDFKSLFRNASTQVFKGKDEKKKKEVVLLYLKRAKQLSKRFDLVLQTQLYSFSESNAKRIVLLKLDLQEYTDYLKKFIDLTERRLIKGEEIPSAEKIFSIFESHTEWITKGKMNPRFELGHLSLITTDQFHFIVDYKTMENEKDAAQVKPLMGRIKTKFPGETFYSHSFDKGFYSKLNYEELKNAPIENIVLPKKGRLNKEEKERENNKTFRELRHAHSAVESNINMLEHHGLNRCPDKGIEGYKRYIGFSVLAYNLHILGNHLIAEERKEEERKKKRREKYRERYFKQAA